MKITINTITLLNIEKINTQLLDRMLNDDSIYREINFFEQVEREDLNDRLLRELDPNIEMFKTPPVIQILEDLSNDISNPDSYNNLKTILKKLFICGHSLQVLDFFDRVIMFEEEHNISGETSFLESLKSENMLIGPKLQKEPEKEAMRMTLLALGCSEYALDDQELNDIRSWRIYKSNIEKEDLRVLLEFSKTLRMQYQITQAFYYSKVKTVADLTSFVSMLTDYNLRKYYIPEEKIQRKWYEKTPKTHWDSIFKSGKYREMSLKQLLENIKQSKVPEKEITFEAIIAKQSKQVGPVVVVQPVRPVEQIQKVKEPIKLGLDFDEIERDIELVNEKYYQRNYNTEDIPKEKYEMWLKKIVKEMLENSPELEEIAGQITKSVQNMEIYIGSYSNQYVYETQSNRVSLFDRLKLYYEDSGYKEYEDSYPNFKRIELAIRTYKRMMEKSKL